jgi:hypothetical protein
MAIIESMHTKQQKATIDGTNFESYVKNTLNSNLGLRKSKIQIVDNRDLFTDKALKDRLKIRVRKYTGSWKTPYLVVKNCDTNQPIALLCCKISLHGRIPLTLFYSLLYKKFLRGKSLKIFLVTPDKGRLSKTGKWSSEWGSYKKPTKCRALSEKFLDGVYVDNAYLKRIEPNAGETEISGNLKPFSLLSYDLISWNETI